MNKKIDYSIKLSQIINSSLGVSVCTHFDGNTPTSIRDNIIKDFLLTI